MIDLIAIRRLVQASFPARCEFEMLDRIGQEHAIVSDIGSLHQPTQDLASWSNERQAA
jgi:hypothetical protein